MDRLTLTFPNNFNNSINIILQINVKMLLILLTAGVKSMKSSAGYRHVRSEFYPQFVAKGIDDVRHLTTTVTGE